MEKAELEELFSKVKGAADKWCPIGIQLDFQVSELNVISTNIQCDEEGRLHEMLKRWLDKTKTSRDKRRSSLVEALNQVDENVLSRDIKLSDCSSLSEEPNESLLRSTSLGNSSVEDEVFFRNDEEVKAAIKEYEKRFSILERNTCTELIQMYVVPEEFINTLIFLPLAIKEEHEQYIEENVEKLEEIKSTRHIMCILHKYWNFFDYSLLEYIIDEYGSVELKDKMKDYVEDLREFRKNTTVKQFVRCWPGRSEFPPNFASVEITLDENPEKWKLEDLEETRKSRYREQLPSVFAVMVYKLKDGSIVIVLSVPREYLSAIIRYEMSEIFDTELKVAAVKIEGIFLDKNILLSVYNQENPNLRLARSILESGISPDSVVNEKGMTPLMVASEKGNCLDLVELLLEYKAEIDCHSLNNVTPLGYASSEGHTDIVTLLLEMGAGVNIPNQVGKTALVNASSRGHVETAQVLLEHGADTEIKNQRGATAMHYAAQNGHESVVELLLDYKANMEETNQPGGTSLSIAAAAGHLDIVKLLLEQGANVNATTGEHHQTPLMFASLIGDGEMVKLILSYDPDVNVRSKNGITALMLAVQGCHTDIVHMLLKEGADPNLAEKETGWTALHIAVRHSHTYITEMLLNNKADPKTSDVSLFDISRVLSKDPMFELFATYGIKEEKGQRSEASANQLYGSDKLLEKIFTQHATELHVQEDQLKRFLAPNADYVEGAQTSLGKEQLDFEEQLKDLIVNVIRTQKYPLSWKFGCSEELIIDQKRDYLAKKYRDDVLDFQDQNKLLKTIKDLKKLSHENVASMKGVCFYEDKYPVLVFEVKEVLYKTLDKANLEKTSLATRLEILHKVASGLTYLHEQRPPIIHYSLTAGNVYVSGSFSEVKIGGIEDGQIIDIEKLLRHFRDTQSIAVYMPPEISNTEPIFTPQFDVFSFGHLAMCTVIKEFSVVLLPHKGAEQQLTRSELERRQDSVSRMDDLFKGDHDNVNKIIKGCLSDEPHNRPPTQKLVGILCNASK